ncbi:MAG: hypothetical protein ABUL72_00835, partial [Armatimonadota bacterium]
MILPAISLCLAMANQEVKTFSDLEQQKYEAFTSLRSFKGHYAVITTKSDGGKQLQDFVYQFGPKGRQMLIMVNHVPVLEYGWNETQIWRVVYPDKTYTVLNQKDALTVPKFEKLPAKAGEVGIRISESGVRFASD